MLRTINYTLLLVTAAITLNACSQGEKSTTNADSTTVTADTVKKAALPLTKLEFLESSFDFGKIDEGKKVEHIFKFKNTGENPLVLQDARASCGCTIPEYTKDTIAPGSEGELKVIYDSANKEGKIDKTVTVTANTEPATTDIKISAFVLKKVDGPYNKQ
ncbi:MAG TPA: DUF1573 domain-containing protein [Cytophagaceae bacterium]|jgi:hypothetical protein|nr:DUF1573 domain-containing protein [Cytophagaceae bacterium]